MDKPGETPASRRPVLPGRDPAFANGRLRRFVAKILPVPVLAVLASLAATAAPAPDAAPVLFPLVRGSEWVYATDLPQGDWVVQAFQTARIGGQDEHDHEHAEEKGRKADAPAEPAGIEHLVFVYSVAKTEGGRRRPVTMQREWIRRADDGAILCGHRFLGNETVFLDPPQTILPADPAPGRTWSWSGVIASDPTRIDATAEAEEAIRVPAGAYTALRVRYVTKSGRGSGRAVRWFAPGVGLVREEVEIDVKGGTPVRTRAELKSFRIGPLKSD